MAGSTVMACGPGTRFRDLHEGAGPFVLANAWSVGSAMRLQAMGFAAIGTSSAALAAEYGLPDNQAGRDRVLSHAAALAAATSLPVSADLEDGFGPRPEDCAETIRMAISAGLAGGSIEDFTGDEMRPIHDFDLAVARVAAAAAAAKASGTGFVLTARAENHAWGREDLGDTIARLRAFEAVGADVLFAPNLPRMDAVRAVCAAVKRPVNVLMGPTSPDWSLEELRAAGVRRVSLGHALAKVAEEAWTAAAAAVLRDGRFRYRSAAVERLGR
ncbi:isocitrate lyase/phosphoenolpyruvate mutase family protein [Roseococcus sp. SYP-B2431]|uniref:isocitrate lyase/PEP mutase family protein n=1 Tax=Roseococcus sp. SYP-B2431 TaxID=2496640 RepID=UPI001F10882F|nr:isocitrate lyase/phosphoenolpyruvate mutase family protein [Roseococcus sp. SYP-B2431]